MKDRFGKGRPSPTLLAAYVDSEVTPSEAAAIGKALAESAQLRRHVDELRHIKEVLSAPIPDLESLDLTAAVRTATGPGLEGSARARTSELSRRGWAAGVVALATCAGLAAAFLVHTPRDDEFQAKSAARAATAPDNRWAEVAVYHAAGGAETTRLRQRLPSESQLLFSYTNLGPAPFEYLMIYAVDRDGEVRWFFPAYEALGTDPASIPIEKGRANVALAELIQQRFHPGKLAILAVFSRRPLRVLAVEAWLKSHPAGAPLPWADVYQQMIVTSVEP